jgi:tetratricopeptide (TPR) repeat protein
MCETDPRKDSELTGQMKLIPILLASFLLIASSCNAEETAYFDWKGLKEHLSKNYTGSIVYFDMAIAQDPSYIDAWIHKGDALRALKDYNASIEQYLQALRLKNDSAAALSGLMDGYVAILDYEKAYEAAARLTGIDSARKDYWLKEGNMLQMIGRYSEASARYDRALEIDYRYKDALYRKGLSLLALGNSSGALDLFERVVDLDPGYKMAHNAKGLALQASGRYDEADRAYEEAERIDDRWSQPRVNRVHMLLGLGRPDEAMSIAASL